MKNCNFLSHSNISPSASPPPKKNKSSCNEKDLQEINGIMKGLSFRLEDMDITEEEDSEEKKEMKKDH